MNTTVILGDETVIIKRDDNFPDLEVSWPDFQNFISGLTCDRGSSSNAKANLVPLAKEIVSISSNAFTHTSDVKTVVMEFEESRCDLRYMKTTYENVLFPKTEMTLFFKKASTSPLDNKLILTGSSIKMITPDGTRKHYPFPNVYQDARICWGSVTLPSFVTLDDYSGSPLYFSAFKQAGFNADLTPPRKDPYRENTEFFEYLQAAEVFPYECI